MHQNSMNLMQEFVDKYNVKSGTVLDIGSMDLNGSYKGLFPEDLVKYIGVDIAEGKNVDIIMDSPEWKKIKDADCAICGQTLEHVANIPKLMDSLFEALKPGGLLCMIAPSAGPPHDYPIWVGHFSDEYMADIVKKAGFEVLECMTSQVEPFRDVRCIARKSEYSQQKAKKSADRFAQKKN